jgi:DNA-directed RNA polymerase specialized sigma24 family protein
MEWLAKIAEHHNDWIQIAQAYGAGDLAEDMVQQAYLKLHKYATPDKIFCKDGHLTKQGRGYVFFTIKTIVMKYHQDKVFTEDDIPEYEDTTDDSEERVDELWYRIDLHASSSYPLYKKVLYRMWRKNYTIREMSELTEVSVPTIVNELKWIKSDIGKKFEYEYYESQKNKK